MNPPHPKVLKDERGQVVIQDLLKFCKSLSDIANGSKVQCSFVHFLAYFNKLQSVDALSKLTNFPKSRTVLHYLCLNGHTQLLKNVLETCP
jgi:ankyrin repeat protein